MLGLAGYIYYWHRKLAPIMAAKEVELVLTPYVLKPFNGPTRNINLGFARLDIPATVPGEAMLADDTSFVVLKNGESPYLILIGPPVSEVNKEMVDLMEEYFRLTGNRADSLFDIKKRILLTQPFAVWDLPVLGKRRAISGAVLLTLKRDLAHAASKIQFIETPEIGALIFTGTDKTVVSVFDKRRRVEQQIFVMRGAADIDQFLAAVIPSYQFTSDDVGEAKWHEQALAAGLHPVKIARAAGAAELDPASVAQIQAEVRRRRSHQAPDGK